MLNISNKIITYNNTQIILDGKEMGLDDLPIDYKFTIDVSIKKNLSRKIKDEINIEKIKINTGRKINLNFTFSLNNRDKWKKYYAKISDRIYVEGKKVTIDNMTDIDFDNMVVQIWKDNLYRNNILRVDIPHSGDVRNYNFKTIRQKSKRSKYYFIVLALSTIVAFNHISNTKIEKQPYLELKQHIEQGLVDTVTIEEGYNRIKATYIDGRNSYFINPEYEDMKKDIIESGIDLSIDRTKPIFKVIVSSIGVLPTLFLLYLLAKSSKLMEGMSTGFMKDEIAEDEVTRVSFDDIAGIDSIKEDIIENINIFLEPEKASEFGARPPKGILLSGPPGGGKTLLAKAIATKADANFIAMNGGDFNQIFMGMGAYKVDKLFKKASDLGRCIIFIDEFDAIASKRSSSSNYKEHNNTLNTLLSKMDGLNSMNQILVIAATNFADNLDPAVKRPGRFDRVYTLNPTRNRKSTEAIIKVHLKNKKVDENLTVDKISRLLLGCSGAEIEGILNNAVLISLSNPDANGTLTLPDIDKAYTRFRTSSVEVQNEERDLEVVAVHEAGHTIMDLINGRNILKVTIQGLSSGIGGLTLTETEDKVILSKTEVDKRVKCLLGGLAATELIFGEKFEGAYNDLKEATNIVYNSYYLLGLGDELISLPNIDNIGKEEKSKINSYLLNLYDETMRDLTEHKDILLKLKNELLDKITIYDLDPTNLEK